MDVRACVRSVVGSLQVSQTKGSSICTGHFRHADRGASCEERLTHCDLLGVSLAPDSLCERRLFVYTFLDRGDCLVHTYRSACRERLRGRGGYIRRGVWRTGVVVDAGQFSSGICPNRASFFA